MIKADAMEQFMQVQMVSGSYGLDSVMAAVQRLADEDNIPVAFAKDQVTSGGLFNKVVEPCLVLYHPDHPTDYYKLAIRCSEEAGRTFISIDMYGTSKQMNKAAGAEWAKQDRRGKSMSYKVGSMIGSGIAGIGRSKQKLEAEQRYYALLQDLLERCFS